MAVVLMAGLATRFRPSTLCRGKTADGPVGTAVTRGGRREPQ